MNSSEMLWFRHDASARVDIKLQKLIAKYGCEGYGMFWVLLEILYENNGSIENDDDSMNIISFQSNSKIDATEFVKYCIKIGLFELTENSISNKRIQEFFTERNNISNTKKAAANKRWSKDNTELQNKNFPLTFPVPESYQKTMTAPEGYDYTAWAIASNLWSTINGIHKQSVVLKTPDVELWYNEVDKLLKAGYTKSTFKKILKWLPFSKKSIVPGDDFWANTITDITILSRNIEKIAAIATNYNYFM